MKKDSIRGWKDVFTFTLVQTLKSKSYRVALILMLTIILIHITKKPVNIRLRLLIRAMRI